MFNHKILYKDIETFISDIQKIPNIKNLKCALCYNHIQSNEPIRLLINNHRLFPNVWIHDECMSKWISEEVMIKSLEQSYRYMCEMKPKFEVWFGKSE